MTAEIAAAPDLTTPATSAEHARTMLESLRAARIAGQVTQRDWDSRGDYLMRVAGGEQNVAPPTPGYVTRAGPDGSVVTMPAELAAEIDAELEPPATPYDYQLNYGGDMSSPEGRAVDESVRQALHRVGVPQAHARHMIETVDRLAARFQHASEHEIAVHTAQVTETLQRSWGQEYDKRMSAVLDELAKIEGPLGDLLEAQPHIVADALLLTKISDALERRAARKRA